MADILIPLTGEIEMNWYSKDRRAVSPIIATILLVAISLVLIGVIFIWVQEIIDVPKEDAPDVNLAVSTETAGDEVYFRILITDISEEPSLNNIEYKVFDGGGNLLEEMTADSEVYGNLAHLETHDDQLLGVGFSDNDADGRLSTGDYFLVKKFFDKNYAQDIDISDGKMILIYGPNNAAMEEISFGF